MERVRSGVTESSGRSDLALTARQMGAEGDLVGLAAVAEACLTTLRQLCERPEACSDLDEMLGKLRALKHDLWMVRDE